MLYSQWLKDWIKIYKKPFVKNHKPIERCISLHIPKRILNKHLSELSSLDIQSALFILIARKNTDKKTKNRQRNTGGLMSFQYEIATQANSNIPEYYL